MRNKKIIENIFSDNNVNNSNNVFGPVINKEAKEEKICLNIKDDKGKMQKVSIKYHIPKKPTDKLFIKNWNNIEQFDKEAWSNTKSGFPTGFSIMDKAFDGGIKPGLILIGGDPNIGKSALLTQLASNLIENNKDICILDFSLDDKLNSKYARMVACSKKVILNAVTYPNRYKNKYPLMLARRKEGVLQLKRNVYSYIPYHFTDPEKKTNYVQDIEKRYKEVKIGLKANNIDKQIIIIVDSFHELTVPNADKNRFSNVALILHDLADKYNLPIIATAELKKKENASIIRRPTVEDIRDSINIQYKALAIMMLYNDVHFKGENATVYFNRKNKQYKQPILEIHYAKNKFGEFKGYEFLELFPELVRAEEVNQKFYKTFLKLALSK